MSTILSNTIGGGAKDGIQMGGDAEFYRDAANILRTPDNITIDSDIYQDDIVYPYMTQNPTTGLTTLTIKCRKFDGNDSANNRMLVHWWIGTASYGAPATLTSFGTGISLARTAGTGISGTALPLTISATATGLQITETDSNETITLTLTANDGGTGNYLTGYLMAEVQGILFALAFSYDCSV